MKKILSGAFICLVVFTASSQKVYMSKVKLDGIICKNWNVDFTTLSGMKIRKLNDATNFTLLMKQDGTYSLDTVTGEKKQGNWVYNTDKKYVLLFTDDKIYARIKAVKDTEMILNLEGEGAEENDSALANLDIHLKPL
ncbi:hypothetical protein [Lutibacter sp.]|uniref:hypothetical protein n=1 Tax=Lutibacter sp. TaxID=1925666 RepID=UPI003565FADF